MQKGRAGGFADETTDAISGRRGDDQGFLSKSVASYEGGVFQEEEEKGFKSWEHVVPEERDLDADHEDQLLCWRAWSCP